MKKFVRLFSLVVVVSAVFSSCMETEDPGPLQEMTREYPLIDFDRLEMGNAFNIRVEQGNTYRVTVRGDRRNLNDLQVYKSGTTLIVDYDDYERRRHTTYVTIEMPVLKSVHFSGATVSTVNGFESDESLNVMLSGASVMQLDAGYRELKSNLSGASTLRLFGLGDEITADLSGGSVISGFDFPVRIARINASGGSSARVMVSDNLNASASGGSRIIYRGSPAVSSSTSGGSSVVRD